MIPVLFDENIQTDPVTAWTDGRFEYFQNGRLTDAADCTVTEQLNGQYTLTLQYPAIGVLAEQLQPRAVIGVKSSYMQKLQLFRVYKVADGGNGILNISANHISYDLSGYPVRAFSAAGSISAQMALNELESHCFVAPQPFVLLSNNTETIVSSFGISTPSSLRGCFVGQAGSIVDRFGGEWYFDNWTCQHLVHRGEDTGVEIRYGKNLTSFSKDVTDEKQYTHIQPFYKYHDQETDEDIIIYGDTISTEEDCSWTYTKILLLDTSQHFGSDSVPSVSSINTYARTYARDNKLADIKNLIKVGVFTISDVQERVSLGDTVHVIYQGETIETRVRKTVWDVLRDRYKSITVGDGTETITQTIKKIK